MNIWETVKEIISLVEIGSGSTKQDEKRIIYLLDFLAFKMHEVNPTGGFDGEEIPENDYPTIRKAAEDRFPNWGFYNTAADITQNIASTEITAGDAIDDITDIVNDLKMVMWSYEHENETNALWHLQDSYNGHWRWHMRNLQCYLHCLENEI
jgi:Domain of unknown function (DUF5063)